ncbi:Hsp70 protein [Asanoa hainanensis]|uniref:Hsp70 protein n=1 Tax=Asanoa hainanensis TaxID=560556 RepID=A0A239N3H1_9ACTN|nr:Hsp70 protein [Asanoa hainanensis]
MDRRASRQLWDNVRATKEMLSRSTSTLVTVPLLDVDATLGREELDELTAPILARTVEATRAAVATAGIVLAEVQAIYLAGRSTRMPAVTTTLHRAFGVAPTLVEQPELVVAEGSLWEAPPADPAPAPKPTRRPRRRTVLVAGLAVALLAAAASTVIPSLGAEPAAPGGETQAAATPSPMRRRLPERRQRNRRGRVHPDPLTRTSGAFGWIVRLYAR